MYFRVRINNSIVIIKQFLVIHHKNKNAGFIFSKNKLVFCFVLNVAVPLEWFLSILFPNYTFPLLGSVQALKTIELNIF